MHEFAWGLPVIAYLFLAGMGAGAVTVSGSVLLRKGGFGASRFAVARSGALIGPLPVMLGTFLIIFELGQPFRALNLYKLINLSPMNIGSWLLGSFILFSSLYAMTFLPPSAGPGDRLSRVRRILAWICVPSGISVGIYTGIMLGAMPSRPFWNSPILPGLFLLSALSSGVASIILAGVFFRRKHADPAILEPGYCLRTGDPVAGRAYPNHPETSLWQRVSGPAGHRGGDPAGDHHRRLYLALRCRSRRPDDGPGGPVETERWNHG